MSSPLAAGLNFVSGMMNRSAQADYNQQQLHQAQLNMAAQNEFARNGIRWKVMDAERAGIHPLFALGAQTTSYANVPLGGVPETGMATGLANASQDISRAVSATRTMPERLEASAAGKLQLEGLSLDNDIKRAVYASAVQKLQQAQNPPMPTIGETNVVDIPTAKKPEDRPIIMFDGSRLPSDKGTTPAKGWEDMLGDDVFSPGFLPNLISMIKAGTKDMSFIDILRAIDRKTSTPTPLNMGRWNLPAHGR